MLKDIPNFKVENIGIAIVPKTEDTSEINNDIWDVYLINLKKDAIFSVLIATKGYGEKDGEQIKTSTLRHFIEGVESETYVLVEPIQKDVFELTNQYWVSFKLNDTTYDKKYIFVKGSIHKDNFTNIPLLEKKGVLIM
jgi:hypothetical protein